MLIEKNKNEITPPKIIPKTSNGTMELFNKASKAVSFKRLSKIIRRINNNKQIIQIINGFLTSIGKSFIPNFINND